MMWYRLGIKDFVLKTDKGNNLYRVFVSNFKRIWHKSFSHLELISICQEQNPLFEAEPNRLLQKTVELFQESADVQREVHEGEKEIILILKTNIKVGAFKFKTTLEVGNEEMLYKELTLPLLIVLKEYKERENKLIKLLKAKDVEIEEYKSEGLQIKRCHLITQPFLEKEFKDQMLTGATVLELTKNPSTAFDGQYLQLMIPDIEMKVKKEEISRDDNTKEIIKNNHLNSESKTNSVTNTEYNSVILNDQKKLPNKVEINHDIKKRKLHTHNRLKL